MSVDNEFTLTNPYADLEIPEIFRAGFYSVPNPIYMPKKHKYMSWAKQRRNAKRRKKAR